jgi:hypothetical protein
VSLFSFELDPHKVLGLSPQATLGEIREAYRLKAKKYHPDAGGEEWAFRILVQSYEMLSSARITRATREESPRGQPVPRDQPAPPKRPERTSESVHSGIHDLDVSRGRILAVELLCVRYLWDDADYLWLAQRAPDEDRFLSCNLNMSWPDSEAGDRDAPPDDRPAIIAALNEIFEQLTVSTRVLASRSRAQDDRFGGWLAYSNFERAWKAVKTLHELLRARGLGLRQWSRDLFIPRGWR